jgi:hypothetical protein
MGKQLVNFYILQLRVECNLFVIYKAGRVLVIGLYDFKPNSGLDLVVRKPKIQKVKEKKKKIIIKVENISPNKIVVCAEMVMYCTQKYTRLLKSSIDIACNSHF